MRRPLDRVVEAVVVGAGCIALLYVVLRVLIQLYS